MASMGTLVDLFVGPNLNTQLWGQFAGGGATLSYGNGATVTYPASSTSSTDGDLSSNSTYDLTASHAFMQVLSVASSATSADSQLALKIDPSNYLRWIVEAGTLFAQYSVAGSKTTAFSVAYSPTTHLWWQIRESGGTTYWDTSSDGITWNNQAAVANPIALTSLSVLIAGTCFQAETNPGAFTWRYFNTADSAGPYNHLRVGDGMSRSEVAN